jgi:hypothetical protein
LRRGDCNAVPDLNDFQSPDPIPIFDALLRDRVDDFDRPPELHEVADRRALRRADVHDHVDPFDQDHVALHVGARRRSSEHGAGPELHGENREKSCPDHPGADHSPAASSTASFDPLVRPLRLSQSALTAFPTNEAGETMARRARCNIRARLRRRRENLP